MSGAEALNVIGYIANVVQLLDVAIRATRRAHGFISDAKAVPEEFRNLQTQLPLLQQILRETTAKTVSEDVDGEARKALDSIVAQCKTDIIALKALLSKYIPKAGTRKATLLFKAILSLRRDKAVQKIEASVSRSIELLLQYRVAVGDLTIAEKASISEASLNLSRVKTELDDLVESSEAREAQRQLDKLNEVDGASHDSLRFEHDEPCYEGTRVEVLEEILQWCNAAGDSNIYWLRGMAGTGKSTISRTVASMFDRDSGKSLPGSPRVAPEAEDDPQAEADPEAEAAVMLNPEVVADGVVLGQDGAGRVAVPNLDTLLGGNYFFSRGDGDLARADNLVTTIAAQLARTIPTYAQKLSQAVIRNPRVLRQNKREQWRTLITQPLRAIQPAPTPIPTIVFVVDALDECGNGDDVRLLLQLFSEAKAIETFQMRFFLTSRPETFNDLRVNQLPATSRQQFVLHDVPPEEINRDLTIFFDKEFIKIRTAFLQDKAWPARETVDILVKASGELFIYAATATRFIYESDFEPNESIALVLKSDKQTSSATETIDNMYSVVIDNALIRKSHGAEQERLIQRFRHIVGSIVIAFETLSQDSIASLLNVTLSVIQNTLKSLHSVLNVRETTDQPIRLLHPSFRDYLLSDERCPPRWLICSTDAHSLLASACLNVLSGLRRNACDVRDNGILAGEFDQTIVGRCFPQPMRYACRYWIDHAQKAGLILSDGSAYHSFVKEHALHWLEAMSILGLVSESVKIIHGLWLELSRVGAIIIFVYSAKSSQIGRSQFHDLVYDLYRFILHSRAVIEEAPLQIYCSALIFSPAECMTRASFRKDEPAWLEFKPRMSNGWGPQVQTLTGHSESVEALAISPNGLYLYSGSWDKTVRRWDVATGALTQVLRGHKMLVNAVAVSPDGMQIISGSIDGTVRVWDASTGALLHILEHSGPLTAVAYSPHGGYVVSAYRDNTVRLWDVDNGLLLRSVADVPADVTAIAFSPDGKHILCGAEEETVRVWDVASGSLMQALEGLSDCVRAVAFSPSGRQIAAGDDQGAICIWDATTGGLLRTLKESERRVTTLAFSPDGKSIVSGSHDLDIRLWDSTNGALLKSFTGQIGGVAAIVYSPNGTQILSGGSDIKVWDTDDKVQQSREGHAWEVSVITISLDGRQIASGSEDHTIRLWDRTGKHLKTLTGHAHKIMCLEFVPDGRHIVSSSNDQTVRIWSVSGKLLHILEGHTDFINSLAISMDGRYILSGSGSRDPTARLWSFDGMLLQTLEGHTEEITALAFSSNGEQLVSASSESVKIWSISGELLQPLEHSYFFGETRFSPDGTQLMCRVWRKRFALLWDIKSGERLISQQDIPDWAAPATASVELDKAKEWILCDKKRLLRLHQDYKVVESACKGNMLVIGCLSGDVIVFTINPDVCP